MSVKWGNTVKEDTEEALIVCLTFKSEHQI